jgi:beta-glucosidase
MTTAEKVGQLVQRMGGRQRALNSRLGPEELDRVRRGEVGSYLHVAGAEPLRALQRVAVEESRLGIPLLFGMDVVHGYRTIFPVPLAMAATWDPADARKRRAHRRARGQRRRPALDVRADGRRRPRPALGPGSSKAPARTRSSAARWPPRKSAGSGSRPLAAARRDHGRDQALRRLRRGRGRPRLRRAPTCPNARCARRYLPPFEAAAHAGTASFMTAFNALGRRPDPPATTALLRGIPPRRVGL